MKKILLLSLFIFILSFHKSIKTVDWNGIDVTIDVTDEDINILGTNYITGDVLVSSISSDINININSDSIIAGKFQSSDNPHWAIFVDDGRTINFNVINNLTFADDLSNDFFITVSGSGNVTFIINDDKSVQFGLNDQTKGGKFFVSMNNIESNYVKFTRASKSSSSNVEIIIDQGSIISFIAEDSIDGNETTKGLIQFDPENSGNGRMILRILEKGCILAQGNKIPQMAQRDLLTIDLDTPAGANAKISTVTPETVTNNSSLFILNKNEDPSDLLIDPWFTGTFGGNRYGFIIGPNGTLNIAPLSYIDYVGLAENFCPSPTIPSGVLNGRTTASLVKTRNASALITDGDPNGIATPATITLGDQSALYFRSGIDDNGDINYTNLAFTIDPINITEGIGNIVFDIEAPTIINGTGTNKLEILSLEVGTTGGSVLISSSETTFPQRTFTKDGSNNYLQYNSACFFINNKLELYNTYLVHTDLNHQVYEKNDTISEPTYIGGDSFKIPSPINDRPSIQFFNSKLFLHSDSAFTGLDLIIPNLETTGNTSEYNFFHNGWIIDNGIGRFLILGTEIGSTPCAATNIISKDVNLNVIQLSEQTNSSDHIFNLKTEENNNTINENISGTITSQYSTHLIYLGHESNIAVGTNGTPGFSLTTNPTLNISGNYISFETKGGLTEIPKNSSITGTGGIFVDESGTISISSGIRSYIGTMVTQRGTGTINLPKSQVYFDLQVGISHWELDLSNTNNLIIIPSDQNLSDYTLNWIQITKGYENVDKPFVKYNFECKPFVNPTVTIPNISSLPTVQGTVDQLQITGSKLGDEAHVMIDGGKVNELVFLESSGSAEISSAVIVLQNHAKVGLNSLHNNKDSSDTLITLGINGITLIPNGDGRVELNENVIVNNLCHILAGPDFGLQENSFHPDFEEANPRANIIQDLEFHSKNGKAIIVKAGGQLDLTSLKKSNQRIKFSGNAKLILEPGAQVFLDGCTLVTTDEAQIVTQTVP